MNSQATSSFSIRESLEPYARLILAFTGSCYAVGILVINVFYSSYGFYSLSLFRLSYVMAGFWAIVTVAVMYPFLYLAFEALRSLRHFKVWKRKQWTAFGMRVIFIVALLFYLSSSISNHLNMHIDWKWFLTAGTGAVGLFLLSAHARDLFRNWSLLITDADTLYGLVFATIMLLGYLMAFSTQLFPPSPALLVAGNLSW